MANGIFFDLTALHHLRVPKIVTDTGKITLQTYAGTTFNMLQFGGTTASYPALKRAGNTIQVRNADDSGYADLTVRNLTITGSQTGGGGGGSALPSQSGNAYKLLSTDGTNPYWTSVGSFSANNAFGLDVSGSGLNTTYGRQQLRISSSASESGLYLKNDGSGGRNYTIFTTSSASGLGGGLFVIADATAAATRMEINSTGHTTFYKDVIIDQDGSLVLANQAALHSASNNNITVYKGDWSGMGDFEAEQITAQNFIGGDGSFGNVSVGATSANTGITFNRATSLATPDIDTARIGAEGSVYNTKIHVRYPDTTGGEIVHEGNLVELFESLSAESPAGGTFTSLLPSSDNLVDIGNQSTPRRFRNIWLTGYARANAFTANDNEGFILGGYGRLKALSDGVFYFGNDSSTAGGVMVFQNVASIATPTGGSVIGALSGIMNIKNADGNGGAILYEGGVGTFSTVKLGHSALSYSSTTAVDFAGNAFQTCTLTGDVTFTSSNLAVGRSKTLRLIASGADRNLTFPGGWVFIGAAAPTSLASGKTGILTLTSFGTTDADVVAAYSAQP